MSVERKRKKALDASSVNKYTEITTAADVAAANRRRKCRDGE